MPRYRTKMPDGESFSFAWDKPTKPTKEEILSLYEARKPKPPKPLLDRISEGAGDLYESATTSFLPNKTFSSGEDDYLGRVMDFGYSRLVQPMASPLGLATLPLAAAGATSRALLGAGGAMMSAQQMPDLFRNFANNPTPEALGDVGLAGFGLAGGTALARGSVNRIARPTAFKPLPTIENPGELLADPPVDLPTKSIVQDITPNATKPNFGITPRPTLDPTGSGLSIPNRLTGPSTNQVVFDALLPSRIKEQIGMSRKGVNINDTLLNLPDDTSRNTSVASNASVARSKNPIIDAGIKAANPEVSRIAIEADKALAGAASTQSKPNQFPKIHDTSIADKLFTSGDTLLKKMGPAGEAISLKLNRIRADAATLAGEAEANIRRYADTLTPDEQKNFGNYVEDLKPIPNDRVKRAVDAYLAEVEKSGIYAENSKLNIKNARGESIPFQRIQDKYWARQYPEGYFDGVEGKTNLLNELLRQGVDPTEAQNIIKNSGKFGERFIDSQHTRQHYRIPGYRTDINAAYKHLADIYKRAQEAVELGPEDVNNPAIKELINQTSDPATTLKILEQQLGRVKHDPQAMKAVHQINNVEAAITLPFMAVGNFSQRFAPIMRSNFSSFAKGVKDLFFDKKGSKESAMRSGALEPVQAAFRNEGGQGFISKLYGMAASEEANRTWAATIGKHAVVDTFNALKKNPKDKVAQNRLKDLLLDTPENVLKQDSLTPEQIKRGQFRMAQITQGITDPVDLPLYWNSSPWMKLPTFLKRFAFQQTRMMKDAILENPTRNIPVALGVYSLVGEGVGDAREVIKGILSQPFKNTDKNIVEEISNAIANRADDGFFQELSPGAMSWLADRASRNLTNAFALGIVEDVINSYTSGIPTAPLEFITGKAISDATKVVYGAAESAKKGSIKPIGRAVTNLSPLTRPIGKEVFSSKETKRKFLPSKPTIKPVN